MFNNKFQQIKPLKKFIKRFTDQSRLWPLFRTLRLIEIALIKRMLIQ